MSVFERSSEQVVRYDGLAKEKGLLEKMNPDVVVRLERFASDYESFVAPDLAMRNYKLALVPFEEAFQTTRTMLKATIGLLESWCLLAGNTDAVKAKTGAWLLGDDEAEDAKRLDAFHGVFVEAFGSAGLPPQLKADVVKKQFAAHRKASAEKPALPVGEQRSSVESEKRGLVTESKDLFRLYHDFLDGYFGKDGDEAFANKQKFAYDRRTLRSGKARKDPVTPIVPAPPAAG